MDSSLIFCANCGAGNKAGVLFCFACSKSLNANPLSSNTVAMRSPDGYLFPGQLLQRRYSILGRLGRGGMGTVYRVQDRRLGREVALKEMSFRGIGTQEQLNEAIVLFRHEALILAQLKHQNLPAIYDHFSDVGCWYLVMELIKGETLEMHQRRAKDGHLFIDDVLKIGIDLCEVLEYLHDQKPQPIIFRDLKPDNIMMTPEKQLVLIDFGIARYFKPGQAKDTRVMLAPGYAAPEQYGSGQTSPLSDIYSLGVTLHFLLSGKHPPEPIRPSPFAPLRYSPFPHLHLKAYSGGTELETLIMQMVEVAEYKRPASVSLIKEKLKRIVAQRTHAKKSSPQRTVPEQPSPPSSTLPSSSVSQAPLSLSQAASQAPSSLSQASSVPASQAPSPVSSSSLAPVPSVSEGILPHTRRVRAVAWSPDGARLATGSEVVQVWDTSTGEKLYTGTVSREIRALVWSPDGKRLASAGWDKGVHVWDATTGRPVFTYHGHTDVIRAVVWSPNGTMLASAGKDKTVQVWNVAGSHIFTYKEHTETVNALAWSPDSTHLASVSHDKTVRVWEATTGQLRFRDDHGSYVYGVAWSAEGQYLASCGEDKLVKIWDLSQNTLDFTYSAHTRRVYAVAWSWFPGSQYIASASEDKKVLIWEKGNSLQQFSCDTGEVLAVAWSHDGKYIAYSDNTKVWVKKVE